MSETQDIQSHYFTFAGTRNLWRHLSLSSKIWVGLSALLLLMTISIGITLYKVTTVEKNARTVIDKRQQAVFTLLQITEGIYKTTTHLNAYLITANPEHREQYTLLNRDLWMLMQSLHNHIEYGELQISKQTLLEIETLYQQYMSYGPRLFELRDTPLKNYPGLKKAEELLQPLNMKFINLINEIIAFEEKNKEQVAMSHERQKMVSLLYKLRYSWVQMISNIRVFFNTRQEHELEDVDTFYSLGREQLDKLKALDIDVGEEVTFDALSELDNIMTEYKKNIPIVTQLFITEAWRTDAYILKQEVQPLSKNLGELLGNVANAQVKDSKQYGTELTQDITGIRIYALVLLSGCLVIGILVCVLIINSAIPNIIKLQDAAQRVADGDLKVQVNIETSDELGSLGKSFNTMVHNLHRAEQDKVKYLDELLELNTSLEQRVRERTAELQQGETRIRTILDSVGEGIITLDERGLIESSNPAANQIFRFNREQSVGLHSTMLLSDEHHFGDIDNDQVKVENALAELAAGHPVEFMGKRGDGDLFPMEVVITDMSLGEQHMRVCIVRDITVRKQTEARLEKAQKQLLETAHKSGMAEIATGVLHNIGNILNTVYTSTEEIRRTLLSCKIENLQRVNAMLEEHLDDLDTYLTVDPKGKVLPGYYIKFGHMLHASFDKVNDEILLLTEKAGMMRDVIRTQQNYARSDYHSEEIDVESIIDDALRVQEASLAKWEVVIVKNYAKVPSCIGQRSKLLQVVTNIVKNAREAMRENELFGKPKELAIRTGADADGRVFICFADNGVGIKKEALKKIFSHGYTTKDDGHGFGLHASANAMTEMNGSITVTSDGEHTGAEFTLTLPVAASKDDKRHDDGRTSTYKVAS